MRYWHWALAVLLSVGLVACGSGASGFGPPPGGGSGPKATTSVTVLNTVTNPQPLAQVHVLGEGETSPTLTGPDGRLFVASEYRLFMMVGLCGGYTTFSSFLRGVRIFIH